MTFQQPPYPPQQPGYPQQQVIYQQVVRAPSNGLGITSLILGIVAIVIGVWTPVPILGLFTAFLAGPVAIVGAILGHMGLGAVPRLGVGRNQVLTGLILNYVTLGIILVTTIFWFVAFVLGSASSATS